MVTLLQCMMGSCFDLDGHSEATIKKEENTVIRIQHHTVS